MLPLKDAQVEDLFPKLRTEGYMLTNHKDATYNCFAHAAGDTTQIWCATSPYFWPPATLRAETLAAYKQAFVNIGYYQVCEAEELEDGYEKIAIFTKNERPSHAARQLPCGLWTSKLGDGYGLSHALRALEGGLYGTVALILRRRRRTQ